MVTAIVRLVRELCAVADGGNIDRDWQLADYKLDPGHNNNAYAEAMKTLR